MRFSERYGFKPVCEVIQIDSIDNANRKFIMVTYKGYTGHVEYDDEAKLFHGEVVDTRDVITFQGTTVEEIETAFRDSIDDYLEFCRDRGEQDVTIF